MGGATTAPSLDDSKGPMPSGPRNDAPLVSKPLLSVVFNPSSVATSRRCDAVEEAVSCWLSCFLLDDDVSWADVSCWARGFLLDDELVS